MSIISCYHICSICVITNIDLQSAMSIISCNHICLFYLIASVGCKKIQQICFILIVLVMRSVFNFSCFSGSVRLPNYEIQSLKDTDLVLSEFCERSDGIPKVHTLNVSSKFCHPLVFFIFRTFHRIRKLWCRCSPFQ